MGLAEAFYTGSRWQWVVAARVAACSLLPELLLSGWLSAPDEPEPWDPAMLPLLVAATFGAAHLLGIWRLCTASAVLIILWAADGVELCAHAQFLRSNPHFAVLLETTARNNQRRQNCRSQRRIATHTAVPLKQSRKPSIQCRINTVRNAFSAALMQSEMQCCEETLLKPTAHHHRCALRLSVARQNCCSKGQLLNPLGGDCNSKRLTACPEGISKETRGHTADPGSIPRQTGCKSGRLCCCVSKSGCL